MNNIHILLFLDATILEFFCWLPATVEEDLAVLFSLSSVLLPQIYQNFHLIVFTNYDHVNNWSRGVYFGWLLSCVVVFFPPGINNRLNFLCLVFYILVRNLNQIQQQTYEMLFSTISKHSNPSNEAPGAFSVVLPSGPAAAALSHACHANRDLLLSRWVPCTWEPVFSSFCISSFSLQHVLQKFSNKFKDDLTSEPL